jgi:hypothetical protein
MPRPPIWDNPEEFEKEVDKYFSENQQPTWTGLANYLGFESRQSLQDYKDKPGFSYSIKKALLRIEEQYEGLAIYSKNPTGAIFALKNFGWKDKQEIDQKTEHSGGISISWQDPKLPDSQD